MKKSPIYLRNARQILAVANAAAYSFVSSCMVAMQNSALGVHLRTKVGDSRIEFPRAGGTSLCCRYTYLVGKGSLKRSSVLFGFELTTLSLKRDS